MIEAGKLIVLNKFSPVEARVTFLLEALRQVEIDRQFLDDRRKAFLNEALNSNAEMSAEESEPALEQHNVTPPSGAGGPNE